MRIVFETINGSRYELDQEQRTWRRAQAGAMRHPTSPLRTEGDPMVAHSDVKVGVPVRICGPSLTAGQAFREITTTPVATVIEPADGADAWGTVVIATSPPGNGEPIVH